VPIDASGWDGACGLSGKVWRKGHASRVEPSPQKGQPCTRQGTVAGMRHNIDSFYPFGLPRGQLFEAKPAYRHRGAIRGVSSAQNAKKRAVWGT
jgi:hypothetical protein